jgi:uncharacterized protein (TIGR02099 family)
MIRRSLRHGFNVLGFVLLALAIALLSIRLMLPHWPDLASAVENRVGAVIQREVSVGSVRLGWSGWAPELVATEVRISVPNGVPLQARELGVSLAPLRSLRALRPVPGRVRLEGTSLAIRRDGDGQLDIHGWRFGGRGSAVLDWGRYLAGLDRMEIEDASLQWVDALTGIHAGVRVDALGLRSDGDGLKAMARGSLLPELGGAVNIGLEVPVSNPDRAEFFLHLEDLQLSHWVRFTEWSHELSGQTSIKLWGVTEGTRVVRIQGEHDSHVFTADARGPRIDSIAHRFHWRRDAREALTRWTALRPGSGDARIEYRLAPEAGMDPEVQRVQGAFGAVDIGRYARVLATARPPWISGFESLAELDPDGWIESLGLLLANEDGVWDLREAGATLRDAGWQPFGAFPGARGVDASLQWVEGVGDLVLEGNGIRLSLPRWFGHELWIDRLDSELQFQRVAGGWRADAVRVVLENEDLALDGRGTLDLGPEPNLDLALRFLRGDGSRVSRYLPELRLPPNTYRWLNESIRAGTVVEGGMVLRGDPREFPFGEQQGLFDLRVVIADGELDYQAGWPPARELSGTLGFRNAALDIEGASGRLLDSRVADARVWIPDMRRQPVLNLSGEVTGPADDLIRYLGESGLGQRFQLYRDDLRPGGTSVLDLGLAIPLRRGGPAGTEVSGRLRLDGARLDLPDVPLALEAIRGEVAFDPQGGIQGRGIQASAHGETVTIDLMRPSGSSGLRILAEGPQPFEPWLGERGGWERRLRGMAHWTADIQLDEAGGPSLLTLSSDLEGVELDWPAPFAKTRGTRRPLEIAWPLNPNRDSVARIRFDNVFAADLRRAPRTAGSAGIEAVSVYLGTSLPPALALPEHGVVLRSRLPVVDVDAWAQALGSLTEHPSQVPRGEGLRLVRADIEVEDTLRWRGRSYPGVRASLETGPGERRVSLDADWLAGTILMLSGGDGQPDPPGAAHWQIHLDRLHIESLPDSPARDSDAGRHSADPLNWPGVDLAIGDLRVGDIHVADLQMLLWPVPDGMELTGIRLHSPEPGVEISGSGTWFLTPGVGHVSDLLVDIRGEDWGSGLRSMGIAQAMDGGAGSGRLAVTWPGSLFAPDLAALNGRVMLNLSDGRLLDVEPGAGRILGLVSLDLVLRRIRLDFRDLYTQGLSFDRMTGEAVIDGGELLLPELRIRSPSAEIRVSGRTGLVARDFDQSVVIVPRLRSTLPIVGALVGGPVAGAIVLLVERVLGIGDQVEEAARVEYFVTGPWSEPEVRARVRTDPDAIE